MTLIGGASYAAAVSTPAPPFDLSQILQGFYVVPALTLLGELGAADKWMNGEAVNLDALIAERKLDRSIVLASADYLRWQGYLERKDGTFAPTEQGKALFGVWALVMIHYAYSPLMSELLPLARAEKTYGHGKDVYREMYFDTKGSGLTGMRGGRFQRLVDYLIKHDHRCLLDFGCGDATFLAWAAEHHPGLQVIGVDQSEVSLSNARRTFEARGLSARARFRQGDLGQPEALVQWPEMREVDIATVWFILHELTFESHDPAVRFLELFRKHFRGVKLAVTEVYRLSDADQRAYAHRGIAEMTLVHDLSRQNMLTRDQWLAIYRRAGFKVEHELPHLTKPGASPAMETIILAPS